MCFSFHACSEVPAGNRHSFPISPGRTWESVRCSRSARSASVRHSSSVRRKATVADSISVEFVVLFIFGVTPQGVAVSVTSGRVQQRQVLHWALDFFFGRCGSTINPLSRSRSSVLNSRSSGRWNPSTKETARSGMSTILRWALRALRLDRLEGGVISSSFPRRTPILPLVVHSAFRGGHCAKSSLGA